MQTGCVSSHNPLLSSLSDCSVSVRSCGCSDSCISDPTGSQWFSERYDPNQQPVLHKSNNSFDPEALAWWLVRTGSSAAMTVYS